MATRFIDKATGATSLTAIANDTTGTRKVQDLPDATGFVFDKVDKTFKYNDAGTIKALGAAAGLAPVVITTATTLDPVTHGGRTVVVNNTAGAAITLPAATGTGHKYKVVIGAALATGDVTIAAAGTDTMAGFAFSEETAGDSDPDAGGQFFHTVNGTTDTITFDQSDGEGKVGDYALLEDIASGVWHVSVWISGSSDVAGTPFTGS